MAKGHYLTLPQGHLRLFRAGEGPGVLILPSLTEAASIAADRIAADLPGHAITVLEWPGIGGSAGLDPGDAASLVAVLADAAGRLGLAGAPILAFDLAGVLAARLAAALGSPRVIVVDAAAARAWAARGWAMPDLAPRPDGAHLTALWAHLRAAIVMDPVDPLRPRRDGPALPAPDALDRAVVAAAVAPERMAALWAMLLAETGREASWSGVDEVPDVAAAAPRLGCGPMAASIPPTAPGDGLWCDHVDTPVGRVHLRRQGRGRPLMVLQSAPGSSAPLAGVIAGLARIRAVVAPDFPGNGDSDKPDGPVDIARLAAMMWDVADALGLDDLDLWGTHTGALVALEMALQRPERVGRMVMEAPPLLSAALSDDILAHYLPPLVADRWGLHLQQAWNMRRDMFLFWPWYRQERAAGRSLGLPDTRMLHDWTVGLLKSGRTYDRSYRAAFVYDTPAGLKRLTRPALVCAGPTDMLVDGLEAARRLAPDVLTVAATPATVWYPNQPEGAAEVTLARYRAFLDREG